MTVAENDDDIKLSTETLMALQSFYKEQEELQKKMEMLREKPLNECEEIEVSMDLFQEDWQLSQFWYSEETAQTLADIVNGINAERFNGAGRVLFISSPSAFLKYWQSYCKQSSAKKNTFLYEYDDRFNVFKEQFIHYDYNEPLNNLSLEEKSVDIVLIDPPFLSEECLAKTLKTVEYLMKSKEESVLLVCTGSVMAQHLKQSEVGLTCVEQLFKPKHKNRLSNEFSLFCNYSVDKYTK